MKIELDLAKHCIETEIKRRHNIAILCYFKEDSDKVAVEEELLLLEKALAAFDFAGLRGQWPELAGGNSDPVRLSYDHTGLPYLSFANQCVVPQGNR